MKVKSDCIKIVTILIACICIVLYQPQGISAYIIPFAWKSFEKLQSSVKGQGQGLASGSFSLFFGNMGERRDLALTCGERVCHVLHRKPLAQGLHRELLNKIHLVQACVQIHLLKASQTFCLSSVLPPHDFLICPGLFCWESHLFA